MKSKESTGSFAPLPDELITEKLPTYLSISDLDNFMNTCLFFKTNVELEKNRNNKVIRYIIQGDHHAIFIKKNGKAYGYGSNTFGQLGLGEKKSQSSIIELAINTLERDAVIKRVISGSYHTLLHFNNGFVYGAGRNEYGQLGLGTVSNKQLEFIRLPINELERGIGIKQIVAGNDFSLILFENNAVYGTGYNTYGQIGRSSSGHWYESGFKKILVPLEDGVQIKRIYAGACHTFFLLTNGLVYGLGRNDSNQHGIESTENIFELTLILKDVQQIFPGAHHTLFLLNTGEVHGCGLNTYGQLGLGDYEVRRRLTKLPIDELEPGINIKQIITGFHTTLILFANNAVYVCGNNDSGRLGAGKETIRPNTFTRLTIPLEDSACIEEICSQYDQTFLRCKDGGIYMCGQKSLCHPGRFTPSFYRFEWIGNSANLEELFQSTEKEAEQYELECNQETQNTGECSLS